MRRFKGRDIKFSDKKILSGRKKPDIFFLQASCFSQKRNHRGLIGIYRNIVALGQYFDTGDMIGMLMGHKDAVKLSGINADRRKMAVNPASTSILFLFPATK